MNKTAGVWVKGSIELIGKGVVAKHYNTVGILYPQGSGYVFYAPHEGGSIDEAELEHFLVFDETAQLPSIEDCMEYVYKLDPEKRVFESATLTPSDIKKLIDFSQTIKK